MPERKSIVFFHPDLGIGGAERLIIDAAVGLQTLGHRVTIFTSHRDLTHCFDEARDGKIPPSSLPMPFPENRLANPEFPPPGTLDVRVRGGFLFPATLLGRFQILLTILRHYHLLCTISLNGELAALKPTAFFIDQLSAGIPFLRYRFPETHILFYCHFPDLLLVKQRQRWVTRLWRLPFDAVEGWSMQGADRVVVNSEFTKGVVEGVWKGLGGKRGVGVVYPCVDIKSDNGGDQKALSEKDLWGGKKIVLSINRFEKKKDVGLAIKAFAGLNANDRRGTRLVIAGGYDNRVPENVSYHAELLSLAESLSLTTATAKNIITALSIPDEIEVLFLLSIPGQLKSMLLDAAKLLVYTPLNEHFGIVPLEAMLSGVPVLAANCGGPLETVVDGQTGWLRDPEKVEDWTEVMRQVLFETSAAQLKEMGEAGRERAETEFSESKMSQKLDHELEDMVSRPRVKALEIQDILLLVGIFGLWVVVMVSLLRGPLVAAATASRQAAASQEV
ncbi:Alpha-1,3-mannosyltransferase-like protein [Xylographa opegraphella]|nr:Alpha-1,3-mannosyltransferase-like protein [Xylographa opegraphella]